LVVGDGDMSFSRSIAASFGDDSAKNLVATTFDSAEALHKKYGFTSHSNIRALRKAGAQVRHEVDATVLAG
jgi:hypothetical protein